MSCNVCMFPCASVQMEQCKKIKNKRSELHESRARRPVKRLSAFENGASFENEGVSVRHFVQLHPRWRRWRRRWWIELQTCRGTASCLGLCSTPPPPSPPGLGDSSQMCPITHRHLHTPVAQLSLSLKCPIAAVCPPRQGDGRCTM